MAKSTEQLMLEKMDQLLRVMTISVTQGLNQRAQIALLNRAGFQPKDIADLLGTTGNTVNKELSTLRKTKADTGPKRRNSSSVKSVSK